MTWLSDARLIPDEVMSYLRKMAVRAVREFGYSPEDVVKIMGFSRSCIYDWLNRFDALGYDGLATKKAPGAQRIITEKMDAWLKEIILGLTPTDFGYHTHLWTCQILAELLSRHYGIRVASETVNYHVREMNVTYQKPSSVPKEQDTDEVERFLNVAFPKIQRFANVIGADIGFEDEAAVDLREHSGKTWGTCGETPEVPVTGGRGRFNILSVVTAKGVLNYHVTDKKINSKAYIEFLKQILKGRQRPLIMIADRATFHTSKAVQKFLRATATKYGFIFCLRIVPSGIQMSMSRKKDKRLGRQLIKSKGKLKKRLHSALKSLQKRTDRVISFFHLPKFDTLYRAGVSGYQIHYLYD